MILHQQAIHYQGHEYRRAVHITSDEHKGRVYFLGKWHPVERIGCDSWQMKERSHVKPYSPRRTYLTTLVRYQGKVYSRYVERTGELRGRCQLGKQRLKLVYNQEMKLWEIVS